MACASAVFPPDKASRCIYVTAPVVHATCTRTLPGHLTRSVELQSLARSSHRDFRNSGQVLCCATQQLGFHQQRLAAEVLKQQDRQPPLTVTVREAKTLAELNAIAWLRAKSFYAYPAERAFAGQIHQAMKAEEEYKALSDEQRKRQQPDCCSSTERSVCLLAIALPTAQQHELSTYPQQSNGTQLSIQEAQHCAEPDVLGTLDLYAVQSLHGEVLIGNSDNAAYLANVCVADHARRRGVGSALIQAARSQARQWGVAALYVHMMAVNAAAARFYMLQGFTCEQEESSNQAHYRGHCLDGIEGRGRTMLLKDTLL